MDRARKGARSAAWGSQKSIGPDGASRSGQCSYPANVGDQDERRESRLCGNVDRVRYGVRRQVDEIGIVVVGVLDMHIVIGAHARHMRRRGGVGRRAMPCRQPKHTGHCEQRENRREMHGNATPKWIARDCRHGHADLPNDTQTLRQDEGQWCFVPPVIAVAICDEDRR